jgi:small-conductance mechanosensitive channel
MLHVIVVVFGFAALSTVAWLLYAYASSALASQLDRSRVDPEVRWNLVQWANPALAVVLAACVVGTFGIQVLPLALATAVALGVLGLAALPAIRSLASGFVLRTVKPFHPGDRVTLAGHTGVVGEIGPFGTTLVLSDGSAAFVPHDQALARPVITAARAGARVEVALVVPPGGISGIEARLEPLGARFEARDGRLFAIVSAEVGDDTPESAMSRLAVRLEAALRG